MRGFTGIVAAVIALSFAASAHAESIVYVKDGDLWLTNVERTVRLTTDGGYESPSQDSAGRIVAVRAVKQGDYTNRFIYRFDSQGNQLNAPVESVDANNSLLVGPLGAEVSPNGTYVAYHYFNYALPSNKEKPRLSFSFATRDTERSEIEDQGYYLNPTWIDNDRVAIFSDPSYTGDLQIYTLSSDSFSDWFDVEGADLTSGDLSADNRRFVAIGDGGALLLFYTLSAPPPAVPSFCGGGNTPNGSYASPTWSPDGLEVAWQEDDGIHLATAGDPSGCDVKEAALIPDGEQPFWGTADLPEPCDAAIPKRVSERKALKAIKVKIDCPGEAKATGKAKADGKTVAKGSKRLDNNGEGTLALRPTRAGDDVLRDAGRVKVAVSVGDDTFKRRVKIVH